MLCDNPFTRGAQVYGCGQCMPCRINRRRQWTARLILEGSLYGDRNGFFTLTYSDAHMPRGCTLEPAVVSLWIKRFRFAVAPKRFRFFLAGEYGGTDFGGGGKRKIHPHYHMCLFGLQPFEVVGTKTVAQHAFETWGRCEVDGFDVRGFGPETARYCVGYVAKKMTHKNDPRLRGYLHPEFSRQSNRPGIGADAMAIVARTLCGEAGMKFIEETGDVPRELRLGRQKLPLGRYLLQKLREHVGFTDEYIAKLKETATREREDEVLGMLETALGVSTTEPVTAKSIYLEQTEGKRASVNAREKLRARRETL